MSPSSKIPWTGPMKDRTVGLALLARMIPSKMLSSLPVLLALARGETGLTKVYYGRIRSLLRFAEHARSNALNKLLRVLKYAVCIVFLINAGSLPFVWHIRVLWHLYLPKLRYWALCLKLVSVSKEERTRALIAWGENLSPVGAHPFEVTTVYRRWCTIDDIDIFGIHLSNSSYAKAFDSARAKALVQYFPAWLRSGGHMVLASTHYHFIREIPPLVRYEVRLSIGSWDHKWFYVVARYVTLPTRRRGTYRSSQSSTPSTTGDVPSPDGTLAQNGSVDIQRAIGAVLHADKRDGTGIGPRPPIIEPDGAILHCVAVSQNCFKRGRITVPPALVLASEGFTKSYGEGDAQAVGTGIQYSHANPPPNWVASQALRLPPHGSVDGFLDFLQSKWRDVPEGQRWWEDALGGSVEAKRQANLEILDMFRLGLERMRTLQ